MRHGRHWRPPLLLTLGLLLGCAGWPGGSPRPLPLSYEVESASGRAFLFGTVHLAREDPWDPHPRVLRELEASDLLALEVEPGSARMARVVQITNELGLLPSGETLRDRVSLETWELVEQRADELGLPTVTVEIYEPWVVALQFIGAQYRLLGYDTEGGVEMVLLEEIGSAKETRGLESAEEQIASFDRLTDDMQELLLLDALRDPEETAAELETLLEAWRSGDAESLAAATFGELEEHPEYAPFYETLFFERNERMAQQVAMLLDGGEAAFVAVGAGHLVGERGVPALLAARGYRVRRVRD